MLRGSLWWDSWFLGLAQYVATASKDTSTKVGAVVVRPDKTMASMGFNGFPKGGDDSEELYNNREEKYKRIIHAEMNALLFAREPLHGYTIYCSLMPCERCAVPIIQAGIKRVVAPMNFPIHWEDSMRLASKLFEESGVELCLVKHPEV